MRRLFSAIVFVCVATSPLAVFAQTPDDINYDAQWYLPQVGAPDAWDVTTGSGDVVVAVLDTGVDLDHPDLRGNLWLNDDEESGNGVDDDGNGFVDDVYGWDFVEDDNDPEPSTNGNDAATVHGTLIAGIIGARGDNGIGVSGVAWNVKIMAVRMLNASGSGDSAIAADAVDYAVTNGADVINLSFAGDNADNDLRTAIERAYRRGVVVVAAMGNDTRDTDDAAVYPACLRDGDHDWVIGVASSDDADAPSDFSNYGSACTDLSAPGEQVYGLQYENRSEGFADAYGGWWSGTSMASPIVAGAVALVRGAFPSLSIDEIRNAIKLSVDPLVGLRAAQRGQYGSGRLNIANALALAAEYVGTVVEDGAGEAGIEEPANETPTARAGEPTIVNGATGGQLPMVDVRRFDGTSVAQFAAYAESFTGGMRVAAGDIDGDGDMEVVTGAGQGGGPHVRVFTETGALVSQFFPYATTSRSGSEVATGDIDGDGTDEILTAVGDGVSQDVIAWSFTGEERLRITASAFDANVPLRVAAGDVDGDGKDEVIVASGFGSAPKVAIYDDNGAYILEFAPYASTFIGGVLVTAGDTDGDGTDEIVTGTGDGGGPHVRIFTRIGAVVGSFFAFDQTTRHGVRVAALDVDLDGTDEIIASPGPGMATVRILTANGVEVSSWNAQVTGTTGTAVAAW